MDVPQLAREIVASAVGRANTEIAGFEVDLHDAVALFDGPGAVLDSLGLITFVFILEEEFAAKAHRSMKITTQDLLNGQAPFKTVASLIAFMGEKLREA